MMSVAIILVIIALYLFYKLVILPKKTIKWYKDTLEGLGYKVKAYNFKLIGDPYIEDFFKSADKHGDSLYMLRHMCPQYDVIIHNTLATPTLQFLNQDLMKGMMQADNVPRHPKMKFIIQNIQRSLGNGIAFSQGDQWKRKRKIMNSVFNFDFITLCIPKIARICDEGLSLYENQCKQKGKMEIVDGRSAFNIRIFEIFSTVFSNVMLECFFGSQSTNEKIKGQSVATFLNKLSADLSSQNFELPILIFGPKFAQIGFRQKDRDINEGIKQLRELGNRLIKKRLKQLQKTGPNQKYQDILEALVLKKSFDSSDLSSKRKQNQKKQTENYDFNELIEEFCTFFTAGTQTTSHFTEMMVYYISENKRIQERLRKQIDEHIKSDEDINRENLKKLVYIDWIQNETTRYYGPGTGIFTRIASNDHFIGNVPIKKGTGLGIQPLGNHFSQKYYKNPYEFRPERWESECNQNPPFAFCGFSGGPRSCIGKHLAMLESKIMLVKFIRKYREFNLPKKNYKMVAKFVHQPQPMDMLLISQKN